MSRLVPKESHADDRVVEATESNEVDKVSYSRYVSEKQATEADDTRREVVKKLLQKLPESERTVITLHYLGEMTIKAVSEFLGVSPEYRQEPSQPRSQPLTETGRHDPREPRQFPTPESID